MIEFLQQFEAEGFYVFQSFLNEEIVEGIRSEMEVIRNNQQFKKAGIGQGENFQIDNTQRGDFIHWIEQEEAKPNTKIFLDKLHELMTELNRNFYLGLRSFECHYTQYPEGTFYQRHTDRHKGVSHRIVSFVFYLNENWMEENGGQLRIYNDDGNSNDIMPQGGSLAIFLSEKEHEVLLTKKSRLSITGWINNSDSI